MVDRNDRKDDTRESQERKVTWKRPSALPDPDPIEGVEFRWIRTASLGQADMTNVSAKMREGWEPVRADEYPDFDAPIVDEGKFQGVIGVGGLILCRIPIETVQERTAYFTAKAEGQMDAVDNDLMKDGTHPSMSISKPNRQSRVTIGGTQGSSQN